MIKKEIKSFADAINGLVVFLKTERHAKLHFLAVIIITFAGFYFDINSIEWCIILLCFGLVIGLELLNTAIEKLCDFIHPEKHASIRIIKDISAGAVLFATILSIIIACIIFIPKF